MKFSTIVTSLLVVSPLMTQAALLRSPPKEEKKNIKTSKAQIVIQGVPQDFSKQDLAVINQSAISAYNSIQKESSYSLVTIKPLLHFSTGNSESVSQCMLCPPDDDQAYPTDDFWTTHANEKVLVADVQVSIKPRCPFCSPDDEQCCADDDDGGYDDDFWGPDRPTDDSKCPPGPVMPPCYDDDDQSYPTDDFWTTTVSNHKLFVESFCSLLATSGSANLRKAHHCSFTFLEKPGHDVAPIALKSHHKEDKKEAKLGFLSVTGLLHELSVDDIAIVESSTLKTFNEAFAQTSGYSELKTLHVGKAVETPKTHQGLTQCMLCPPDDDQAYPTDDFWTKQSVSTAKGSVLLLDIEFAAPKNHAEGLRQCMLCPPDDDQAYPTDDFWKSSAVGVKQCMLCPPDDDQAYPTDDFWGTTASNQKLAFAFSHDLCSKLRNSGSPNLALANDCALDFFYEHDSSVGEKKEKKSA